MGFNFKLSKSDQKSPSEKSSGKADDSSSLSVSAPSEKPDWTDKTSSNWREHTGFLEQTRTNGIMAPPRMVPDADDGTGLRSSARITKMSRIYDGPIRKFIIGFVTLGPALAAAMYFGPPEVSGPLVEMLGLATSSDAVSQIEAVPPVRKIASNPNKAKAVQPETAAVVAAEPTPIPPLGTRIETMFVGPPAPLQIAKFESELLPLIRLSTQPGTPAQKAAIPRDFAIITFDRDEVVTLRKVIARDASMGSLLSDIRTRALPYGPPEPAYALATLKGLRDQDEALIRSRAELKKIREITMAFAAFGDIELARLLRSKAMAWANDYVPLGDPDSDAELTPVFEAVAFLQSTLPPDDRGTFDRWMLLIADRQVTEMSRHDKTTDLHYAKHLKTMSLIGFATGNKNVQNYARAGFASHVASSILPDGSTTTYQRTHSVRLHAEHLEAILRVSVLMMRAQIANRELVPTLGGQLAKAIDFTTPFAIGRMEHREFQGVKSSFGEEHIFAPASALTFLDTVLYFRPSMRADVAALAVGAGHENASIWDAPSFYYTSMIRKTDDFEQKMMMSPGLRIPATSKTIRK